MAVYEVPSLLSALSDVPDFRCARGKQYALPAVLAIGCAGMLSGCRTYGAMAEWGKQHAAVLVQALGLRKGRTPSVGTLHAVFTGLDVLVLEQHLGAWAEKVLAALALTGAQLESLAIDGKCLRGSQHWREGTEVPGVHLLSALSHRLGVTLGQVALEAGEGEVRALERLWDGLVLTGRVVTLDAGLTGRQVAQDIRQRGGTM